MREKEEMLEAKERFKQQLNKKTYKYEKLPTCSICGTTMKYIYGETYECPYCKNRTLTDFGKVRDYLDENGPRTAIEISDATGVSLDKINQFLREGRIEIPDNSNVFIKCVSCGVDIKCGRYCPNCTAKLSKQLGKGILNEVGDLAPVKSDMSGKMHIKLR